MNGRMSFFGSQIAMGIVTERYPKSYTDAYASISL